MKILLALPLLLFGCSTSKTENPEPPKPSIPNLEWETPTTPSKAHFRGLDIAQDGSIWASGTQGTVMISTDQGQHWTVSQIPGCEALDFRDVEGFDKSNAVVMSSGNGVQTYFTTNGGRDWTLAYEDTTSSVFFDGMDFNGGRGMAYGDPQDVYLDILHSSDSGRSWERGLNGMPSTIEGEAGFAASGTGIVLGKSSIWIATGGGAKARVFRAGADSTWSVTSTPFKSAASSGIFSMAFFNNVSGILTGGDYIDSTLNTGNAAYSTDGGLHWIEPESNPGGYRSCVAFGENGVAYATGRSGTDYSDDLGKTWKPLSEDGYFSCVVSGSFLIGVGRSGKIGRLKLD